MTFLHLDIPLLFRLTKIKEKESFLSMKSIAEKRWKIHLMNSFTQNHSAPDKHMYTWLVLLGASSGVSLCSFTTLFGTIVGIAYASSSLVFCISNKLAKMFLKTMGWKKA